MTTALIYDVASRQHQTGHHPENPRRFDVILEELEADAALWPRLNKLAPREASDQEVARCHSERLIEQIRKLRSDASTSSLKSLRPTRRSGPDSTSSPRAKPAIRRSRAVTAND